MASREQSNNARISSLQETLDQDCMLGKTIEETMRDALGSSKFKQFVLMSGSSFLSSVDDSKKSLFET